MGGPVGPQILGWQGYVRVDDITYSFLGDFPDNQIVTNISRTIITPTRTTWTMPAGPMEINVTFFSPIEPGDPIRQSIPFSYLYFEAVSTNGAEHSVQVYSDISAEWSSGNRSEVVQWSTVAGSNSIFHQVFLSEQTTFKEIDQQAEWGTLYYSTKVNSLVTYKVASDQSCRDEFHDKGKLDFGEDTQFRGIASSFPVYAIATDLGAITSTQDSPVVWAIGYTRDPASKYSDASSLINDFLDDFPNAKNRADQLDAKILTAANNVSSDYADLVSLAARQVFGATELTISKGADGNWSTSDVMMFMKNIGESSRNRVNAVEVLYQSFPLFMYVDPTLGGPLLEPLLRFQNSTNYTNPYAAQDIGSSYPVALASNHTHNEGVEQSANMLIMAYAHARATGDGSLAFRYYNLFSRWTDFLIGGSLHPTDQASSDTGDATNLTNLAIKGIIAIKAMSELSMALGRVNDAQQYSANATQLVQQWTSQALSSDKSRLLETYGDASSMTLGYNLFADRWLGTQLVDQSVYNAQTGFFAQISSGNTFGLPTDSSDPGHASSSQSVH
ncbi:hypothetical protein EWM64_g7329 [Hericium alpestre]|uniref:DUF1793 domain-containing protein n=1 Tax=Hericium alpestre TaxID=135208 RepID=A0A4Y9ZQ21_9AGAM|nr:hypothetical protein EWM64_g7329 [Hericium alpestre]